MTHPIRLAGALLAAVLVVALQAEAHEPGLSQVSLWQGETWLRVELRFDADDWHLLERAGYRETSVQVEAGGRTLEPLRPAEIRRTGDHVDVSLRYGATGAQGLRFEFTGFGALRYGHRQYVELRDASGERIADALLHEGAPATWLDV